LQYGYSCVGRIIATGAKVDPELSGCNVFAFHPHQGHFAVRPEELIQLPKTLAQDDAVFFALMETALTLVLDGRPLIGERVMVFGLGMVGLLATALLARFPLAHLACVDPIRYRRKAAKQLGAHQTMSDYKVRNTHDDQKNEETASFPLSADLIYELSGNPSALNNALTWSEFDTRIVIGSWYGAKQVPLNLGGRFHRNRIQLISSQVSTIAPGLSGRWSRQRRTQTVLHWLETLRPSRWITHRYPVTRVQEAYARIAAEPESTLQVVLEYP
jgi:threonine dehydrogenase-like Zn-dependent dehydrogenase